MSCKCRPMSDCPICAMCDVSFDLSSYGALQPITFHIGGIYGAPPLSLLTPMLISDEEIAVVEENTSSEVYL